MSFLHAVAAAASSSAAVPPSLPPAPTPLSALFGEIYSAAGPGLEACIALTSTSDPSTLCDALTELPDVMTTLSHLANAGVSTPSATVAGCVGQIFAAVVRCQCMYAGAGGGGGGAAYPWDKILLALARIAAHTAAAFPTTGDEYIAAHHFAATAIQPLVSAFSLVLMTVPGVGGSGPGPYLSCLEACQTGAGRFSQCPGGDAALADALWKATGMAGFAEADLARVIALALTVVTDTGECATVNRCCHLIAAAVDRSPSLCRGAAHPLFEPSLWSCDGGVLAMVAAHARCCTGVAKCVVAAVGACLPPLAGDVDPHAFLARLQCLNGCLVPAMGVVVQHALSGLREFDSAGSAMVLGQVLHAIRSSRAAVERWCVTGDCCGAPVCELCGS